MPALRDERARREDGACRRPEGQALTHPTFENEGTRAAKGGSIPRTTPAARLACVVLLGLALGASHVRAASENDKQAKKLDTFWTAPDIANISLRSIAMLPCASYDNNLKTEKELEIAWGQVSRPMGYRWYYPTLSKDLLRRAFGGDSILTALRASLLKEPRVDSLSAQRLCQALRTSAVFTMRADNWEQVQMEWNQDGKPWTRVTIKAALVDSSGRLLWTASGSETGEGPLHSADAGTIGVKSSGLGLQPVTGQGGAPSFQEVLTRLFARWSATFPAKAAPATPAPGGGS